MSAMDQLATKYDITAEGEVGRISGFESRKTE